MHYPPWHEHDLDADVAAAIRDGSLNTARIRSAWTGEMSLIAALYANDRFDLADRMIAAGATMTAGDIAALIWSNGTIKHIEYLLARGVPHDDSCLTAAVSRKEGEIVDLLLENGANPNAVFDAEKKISVLHTVAWMGNTLLTDMLLAKGATVDSRDIDGMTPLMRLCDAQQLYRKGVYLTVRCLLRHGADPNAANQTGDCPLLLCASKLKNSIKQSIEMRTKIALVLLVAGADPNVLSQSGTTPLMLAARDNDTFLAKVLLDKGANREIKTPDGKTALDIARDYGSSAVQRLLEGG